jgi:hypothetical protein
MYGPIVHTGIDMCVYPDRRRVYPSVHMYSIAIHSSKYMCICVDIHPFLDTYISERNRDTRVGARLCGYARGCARVGLHLPQGTVAAPNAPVCLSRACVCVCVHAWRPSMASACSTPRLPVGASQVDLHHEGAGAPRLARPVQALGGTVRPAARGRCARLRRCRAPGRATRRWMRRRRRCRSSAAAEPRSRMAAARGRPARGK